MAFLREQISSQGGGAHPLKGAFRYDVGDDIEIVIGKMPDDPDGLDWSQLQTIVDGLWEYIVTGMRYRTVSFDVLNVEDDAQIAWGQLVKWETGSLSDRIAKRGVQLSSLTLASSGDLNSGQRSSSLPTALGTSTNWPVKDTDMTLRFNILGKGPQRLDREAVVNLFVDVIKFIDNQITTHGEEALLNADAFTYGGAIVLEVINWIHVLAWGHLATAVLGLIDFMVDHSHSRSWYFSIFVQDPKLEIAIGSIKKREEGRVAKGLVLHNNVTVARRSFVNGVGAG